MCYFVICNVLFSFPHIPATDLRSRNHFPQKQININGECRKPVCTLYPFGELNPESTIRCYQQIQEEMLIFESQEA